MLIKEFKKIEHAQPTERILEKHGIKSVIEQGIDQVRLFIETSDYEQALDLLKSQK